MALLAVLVLLWRSIAATSESPVVEPPPAKPAEHAAGGTSPAPALAPAIRAPLPAARRPSGQPPPSAEPGAPPPTLVQDEPQPGSRDNTKNLEWGLPQMRALVAETGAEVNECLRTAAASGVKPTGAAQLTFIAAKRGDKIVIEETGVDHDQTTLDNEPLLDCLHGTSKALQFAGLPREATAVFVTRSVRVENGGLVENTVLKFSYIR